MRTQESTDMSLNRFKAELKNNIGKRYSMQCLSDNGTVIFELPVRVLKRVDTVKLGFESHRTEGEISYADFPAAGNFEGNLESFSFRSPLMGRKLVYELQS